MFVVYFNVGCRWLSINCLDLHVICEYQGVMYIKLKYVVVFLGFVLLVLRNIENLLSTRAETSSDLFLPKVAGVFLFFC